MRVSRLFCVVIKDDYGKEHIAHSSGGLAIYYNKTVARQLAEELRESEYSFKARVMPCTVSVHIKKKAKKQ